MMIAKHLVGNLQKHQMPIWFAVCVSTLLLCLGQFGFVEGWQAILFLNTGGVGLISCLGLSEIRRRFGEQEIRKLQQAATTDPLTGVGNRRSFDQEIIRRVTQFRRYGTPCSLLIIDADHFKTINDTWGHDAGDQVLISMAKVIAATLRDIDPLFRIGGEEFAALLPETVGQNARTAAERVRVAVSESQIPAANRRLEVTVSIGGSELLADDSVECWFKRADTQLYVAKKGGRNRISFDESVERENKKTSSSSSSLGRESAR
jgi:diguanylate cyclase (GGDEF)-like protein